MGIYKDKAERLDKICKEQGEKIRELKAKLEDRNSKISELKSELSDKEGMLNIKNGMTGEILFPRENEKVIEEILNVDTNNIQDDVHRFGIEQCQKCVRGNDRKKEFDEICDMFSDCMEECNKSGVVRFLAELTQKLRNSGVMYTVELLDGEINVKDIFIRKQSVITVDINGIQKEYRYEKICEIVRAYEDIQHCKEHTGEHLHSEEHLKIIQLRQQIECLERNSSLKDELIKTLKKDSEEMKKRIGKANDRHQSDCIEKTQLHTALDVITEKYQRLREIHGL